MRNSIKKTVREFIKRHSLKDINYTELKSAAERLGYTVIEFNAICNDEDVGTIIRNLGLDETASRSRGFVYADENYRFVFINESLSADEKRIVIAHELGHIVFDHTGRKNVLGDDVRYEHEANEFAHYLLHRSPSQKVFSFVLDRKKLLIPLALALLLAISATSVFFVAKNRAVYTPNFYITKSGDKYHECGCIFVKDKTSVRRLTKDDFNSGKYEPCDVCLPK